MVATAAQLRAVSPAALPLQQLRTKTRFALSIAHITPSGSRCAANKLRAVASDADEVSMLEKMLKIANVSIETSVWALKNMWRF